MNRTETPWGAAQSERLLAPGLTWFSTAGHGGMRLSKERLKEFEHWMPGWTWGYAPRGWLEEDCDANGAALVWPREMEPRAVRYAVQWAECSRDTYGNRIAAAGFLTTPRGQEAVRVAREWETAHAGDWQKWGASGDRDGWHAEYRRVCDGARRVLHTKDYPPELILGSEMPAETAVATGPIAEELAAFQA